MSDKREAWRPTLSPRANSVNAGVNQPSEATRGAAQHAFNAGLTTSNTSSTVKAISSGARSAAAAAGNAQKPAITSAPGHNATNTTSASFAVAAYARGRPSPSVERQSSTAGLLFRPTLSPMGLPDTQSGALPDSSAQQAARMASKSRSPARRTAYSPSPQDKVSMPQDRSALAAGKLASLRSHQDPSGTPSSHSQISIPTVEQPAPKVKQINYLPKKPSAQAQQGPISDKLAGAAAAQAAAKHAQPQAIAISPRIETREDFPVPTNQSFSSDRSTMGGSLEAISTKSPFASPTESGESSALDDSTRYANNQQRSAPIPTRSTRRGSPGTVASSSGANITDYRIGLTEKSLADAIVAGSLASSRASSPTKIDASLAASRRSRSHSSLALVPHHFLHHERASDLHTKTSLAPSRNLKHTLRKRPEHQEEDEDEITKRGRKHFMRKHPHKHHEGDRKRWRDKVTERERRRYEGVWAANRGLLTFWEENPTYGEDWKRSPEYDLVVNVVVRDIWERSRLPKDVLEEIWDLVATSEDAQALQRDQFVVGLWLIDQRLKGRKLPVRVSSDVWNSVRHTQGVTISRRPY